MSNFTREWSGLTLETFSTVGTAARNNRGRYTGTKYHLLSEERVIAIAEGAGAGRMKIGSVFSVSPRCGATRGQFGGQTVEGLTTVAVTCDNCRSILGLTQPR